MYVKEMGPNFRALVASFRQRCKEHFKLSNILGPIPGASGPAITLGWAAGKGDNPEALAFIFVGFSLYTMWLMGIAMIGWSLSNEAWVGTLDLMMTTRTPLPIIMLGKALGIMAFTGTIGVIAFFVVLVSTGATPSIESVPLLAASVFLSIASLISIHFIFAPAAFMYGTRAGFIGALMPLGGIITGFLFPIGLLPAHLDIVARCLPTSWAMDAVVRSINQGWSWHIAGDWALAIALACVFFTAACLLFGVAEKRARRAGNLGAI